MPLSSAFLFPGMADTFAESLLLTTNHLVSLVCMCMSTNQASLFSCFDSSIEALMEVSNNPGVPVPEGSSETSPMVLERRNLRSGPHLLTNRAASVRSHEPRELK